MLRHFAWKIISSWRISSSSFSKLVNFKYEFFQVCVPINYEPDFSSCVSNRATPRSITSFRFSLFVTFYLHLFCLVRNNPLAMRLTITQFCLWTKRLRFSRHPSSALNLFLTPTTLRLYQIGNFAFSIVTVSLDTNFANLSEKTHEMLWFRRERPVKKHECNGMTSVNVSLISQNDNYFYYDDALVGVIYYKDLEDALNRSHEVDDNK